jgi:hypothetical protein
MDMDYLHRMFKLYSKVSPHEQIIGWFSNFPRLDSVILSLHQTLAAKYYKTAETPFVYLTVDPSSPSPPTIKFKVPRHFEAVVLLRAAGLRDLQFGLLLPRNPPCHPEGPDCRQ